MSRVWCCRTLLHNMQWNSAVVSPMQHFIKYITEQSLQTQLSNSLPATLTRWVTCSWVGGLGSAPFLLASHLVGTDCLPPGRPTSWTRLLRQPEQLPFGRLSFAAPLHGTMTISARNLPRRDGLVTNTFMRHTAAWSAMHRACSWIWFWQVDLLQSHDDQAGL